MFPPLWNANLCFYQFSPLELSSHCINDLRFSLLFFLFPVHYSLSTQHFPPLPLWGLQAKRRSRFKKLDASLFPLRFVFSTLIEEILSGSDTPRIYSYMNLQKYDILLLQLNLYPTELLTWGRCMCYSPCRYSAVPVYCLCTWGCLWDHILLHGMICLSPSLPPLSLSLCLLKPHFKDHNFVILRYLDRWASPLCSPSSTKWSLHFQLLKQRV